MCGAKRLLSDRSELIDQNAGTRQGATKALLRNRQGDIHTYRPVENGIAYDNRSLTQGQLAEPRANQAKCSQLSKWLVDPAVGSTTRRDPAKR